jgi:hypothetical protein
MLEIVPVCQANLVYLVGDVLESFENISLLLVTKCPRWNLNRNGINSKPISQYWYSKYNHTNY